MAEALKHYGDHCIDCGEADPRVLTLIPGGGHGRLQLLYYLSSHNWPKADPTGSAYQILCLNCKEIRQIRSDRLDI